MATHEVEVQYYLYPTDEWVEFMKANDGTRHWAGDYESDTLPNGDLVLEYPHGDVVYDTETLLRGLQLYALSHSYSETQSILLMKTDSHERDHVWQLGFFGEYLYYG